MDDYDDETSILEKYWKTIEVNEDLIEIPGTSKNKNNEDICKPLNFQNKDYLKEVKQAMYKSMTKYWQTSCVLDPRFKNLRFTSEAIRNNINNMYRDLHNILMLKRL